MKQNDIENIYKTIPLKEIPWNIVTPPDALVKLIENKSINPCKTIDLGCGAGNYAIYLSKKGFNVTAVDVSPTAIKHAEDNARKKDVNCNFIVADVVEGLEMIKERFDFAYDWTLLHHIYPEERKRYVKNVYEILNPCGKYLSVCFSEKDSYFEGEEKNKAGSNLHILLISNSNQTFFNFANKFV